MRAVQTKFRGCPACDDSDRVPTRAAELCQSCLLACGAAIERKRCNGGIWHPDDVAHAERVARGEGRAMMLRRLTIAVIESAQALLIARQMEGAGRYTRAPAAFGGGKR